MNKVKVAKLIQILEKDGYAVFSPAEKEGRVLVRRLEDPKKYAFVKKLPYYSYKAFFFAPHETLFDYEGGVMTEHEEGYQKIAIVGIRKIDLKAVAFYDEVFKNDSYYQKRRKNIAVIAHDLERDDERPSFLEQYDRDKLEDLPFDIFLQEEAGTRVFSGSPLGERLLKKAGYKKYQVVKYSGARKNDKETLEIKAFMDKAKFTDQMWEDLGKLCIACGQCTLSCPTCYCFAVMEEPALGVGKGQRARMWDACFYSEFSRVTGEHRFQDTVAKKIHFWYTHKFSRDAAHVKMAGCIGCERCTHSCPVDINIRKVLASMALGGASYSNDQKEEYPLKRKEQ